MREALATLEDVSRRRRDPGYRLPSIKGSTRRQLRDIDATKRSG